MIQNYKNTKELIANLNKNKLNEIVKNIHEIFDVFDIPKNPNIEKRKKEEIINYISEKIAEYLKCFIMLLDESDYEILKTIILKPKKVNEKFLVDNKDFINTLLEKNILFKGDDLEISNEVNAALRSYLKDKQIIKKVQKTNYLYNAAAGIIVAYGVVDSSFFKKIVENIDENALDKLKYYNKKEYVIDSKKVISTKLTNKKKINSYLKNKKYKEFSNEELASLGNMKYHHSIKEYKKLIKMLKNNYVFKNSDITYIDSVVIIPYLYNSINEEETANKNLEETIIKLFEFKGDKLKNRMIQEIKVIRDVFPIWEYRGYTKNEVEKI